eukprot:5277168-Amphidinium_carterae.1
MFSGACVVPPTNTFEADLEWHNIIEYARVRVQSHRPPRRTSRAHCAQAIFAELYIVSSGLFVTLIGSSLAAKLIQSQLQHQDSTHFLFCPESRATAKLSSVAEIKRK